jgi:hypothetical protein
MRTHPAEQAQQLARDELAKASTRGERWRLLDGTLDWVSTGSTTCFQRTQTVTPRAWVLLLLVGALLGVVAVAVLRRARSRDG